MITGAAMAALRLKVVPCSDEASVTGPLVDTSQNNEVHPSKQLQVKLLPMTTQSPLTQCGTEQSGTTWHVLVEGLTKNEGFVHLHQYYKRKHYIRYKDRLH